MNINISVDNIFFSYFNYYFDNINLNNSLFEDVIK